MKQKIQLLKTQVILLSILSLTNLFDSHSQAISFEKIGVNEGLSQMSVLSIHKDHLNRMWFGTRNGLNCWDGETMKSYYPNEQDSILNTSFSMIKIIQLDNFIWLQSRRLDLVRFDLNTLKFDKKQFKNIYDIDIHNNTLVACNKQEVLTFQQDLDTFKTTLTSDNIHSLFSKIYNDVNETLWLVDKRNNTLKKVEKDSIRTINLPNKMVINDLLLDSKERLWIATQFQGIYIYDESNNSFENINNTSQPYQLENNNVRSIKEDKKGRMWIGTFGGVTMFDFCSKKSIHNTANSIQNNRLSNNSVHSLYISDNNIWVGTYYGGVNYKPIFNSVYTSHFMSPNKGINYTAIISDMAEDKLGNIWIGTEGDGLYYYNIDKKKFTHYKNENNNKGPSQPNIKALYLAEKYLLIGTYRGGLNILDLETKKFKHYDNEIKNLVSIEKYNDNFLLGSHRGVYAFNMENESFQLLLDADDLFSQNGSIIIRDLHLDSKGILWIGTAQNGLIKYHTKTKKLTQYLASNTTPSSISSNAINYIFEDESSQMWFGTIGGGLNRYNCKLDNFKVYNSKNSQLQDNYICSIIESRLGNIWVATSSGISILNKKNEVFYNYSNNSGFPITELNTRALLQTSSGNMFVGGISGLVSFKESDLLLSKNHYNVIFSDLEVNNSKVFPNDHTNILTTDISTTGSITLQPEHSSFKINFSACNYNPFQKCNYQYKLEGFNGDWIDAKFSTYASYTNLNSGKYTFKIRAVDMDGQPTSEVNSLNIKVKPPVRKRWYAYILYILIVIVIIFVFNYIYLGKVSLALQLKNEKKENERIKELNLYKLRFFTNISHEFMTPLTIMLSILEDVLKRHKLQESTKNQLQKINYNAIRLKNLNHELLDFRRIEQGYLKLSISKNDIIKYVNQCYEAFEDIARIKNIEYTFEQNTENIPLWFDPVQMDKVFYNLLSNAFNHVENEGGIIQIEIHNKADELLIEVSNNGKGIPKDEIKMIFNRFFQSTPNQEHNEYYGSGIGLALSQSIIKAHHGEIWCSSVENHFTTFSVLLKKDKTHFDPNSIKQNSNYSSFTFEKDLIFDSSQKQVAEEFEECSLLEAPVLLIVDDNREICDILKNIFAKNYHILFAEDGDMGLKMAIEKQPNIIISDIKMPKLSGLEMCEILKRNISTSHIPIVLLSALSSEEDEKKGFDCGADAFISKPFKTEILLSRIENLLKNKSLIQNKFNADHIVTKKNMPRSKSDKKFIDEALVIIENNNNNSEFSITDFAKAMNMSRTLFFQKIKTITGLTPNDFIQNIRLNKAAELLINDPNSNVSQIAYSLGFNSPQYFSRCFKSHFGISPSKYGKQKINL